MSYYPTAVNGMVVSQHIIIIVVVYFGVIVSEVSQSMFFLFRQPMRDIAVVAWVRRRSERNTFVRNSLNKNITSHWYMVDIFYNNSV